MNINSLKTKPKNKVKIVEIGKTRFDMLTPEMLDGIIGVAFNAFGDGMTKKEVLEHVYPTDRVYLVYDQSGIIGFATATLKPDAVDLSGVALLESVQGNGIYSVLCSRRINYGIDNGRANVEFSTQNPKIELGVRLCLEDLLHIGLISGYNITKEIKPKHYGRILTKERPLSGVNGIDKEYDVLDYELGDGFGFRVMLSLNTTD